MNFVEPLLNWYACSARDLPWRRQVTPYAVWVSEVMLQQTRVSAVIPYYTRFLSELPDVEALAKGSDERLHKLWEGLGYYSRARNLKRAAQVIAADFCGKVPTHYETLLTLPGIGAYTAGAIASIAGNEPVPAVDGNVLRVWARLNNDARDVMLQTTRRAVQEALAAVIPRDRPGMFNSALMELGACICVPNGAPHCQACPVGDHCAAKRAGTAPDLPVKSQKKPRRIEEKTVFALLCNGRAAGYRRAPDGLLAGLWQLPDVPGILDETAMAAQLTGWGARVCGEVRQYARKHIFTHIEWRMRVYCAETVFETLPEGWRWLDETNALPTAYRACLQKEDVQY